MLAGCGENDAEIKYRKMKAESLWMLATCEQQKGEPIYTYSGGFAVIRQTCRKESNTDEWRTHFKKNLMEKGWVLRSTTSTSMYCLGKTGIVFFLEEYANEERDTTMHFYSRHSSCPR